jgi:hypothetical protein
MGHLYLAKKINYKKKKIHKVLIDRKERASCTTHVCLMPCTTNLPSNRQSIDSTAIQFQLPWALPPVGLLAGSTAILGAEVGN